MTDPPGRISRFEYDAAGNLTRVTYPDGTRITHDYDSRHLMTGHRDESGNTYTNRYDPFGKVIDGTLPDGTVRADSNQASAGLVDPSTGLGTRDNPAPVTPLEDGRAIYTDGRGNRSMHTLDPHGQTLISVDELGRINTHVRDADSNPVQSTRPNGSVVERTFDAFGNVLSLTERFNGAFEQFGYDDFALVTSYTNPNRHTTTIRRDPHTGTRPRSSTRSGTPRLSNTTAAI